MAHGEAQAENLTHESNELESSLLDSIIDNSRAARDEEDRGRARDLISELVSQVLDDEVVVSGDLIASIDKRIADIDALLSEQVNEIMHHDDFQKLEGSWRGLKYLVQNSETGTNLKIRMFNANKKELLKDLTRAPEFDQSTVFKRIYEDEFGQFGGAPYGALIGDFEFTARNEDMALLEEMSHVAAAGHAPFVSAASANMFGLETFTDLGKPRDLSAIFESTEYARWSSFRSSEDSRYVGLTLPHVLGRLPYGSETESVETFNFEEDVSGKDHSKYLWTNAAYSFGVRFTEAFANYGWCAAIRGVEGGGVVEGLPAHTFETDEGDVALKCPTEIAITDRREKELADNGFIPLVHCKGTDYAAFFSAQSAQKSKIYNDDAATANSRLSAQLPYLMATSRIAHYMKAMMRDKIGSFASRENVEDYLNKWIVQYVSSDDTASQETKAQYPLREAQIEVAEVPGKPGAYKAVSYLRPHYQLEELAMSLRLVADLPNGQG